MCSYRRRGSDGENRNRLKGSENAIKEGCDALYKHIIPYIIPRERRQEISGGILLKNIVGVCRLPECSQRRAVSLFLDPSAPPSCILMLFILTSKLTTANYPSDMCALLPPPPNPHCACVCCRWLFGASVRLRTESECARFVCKVSFPVSSHSRQHRVSLTGASEDVYSAPASGDSDKYRQSFVIKPNGFLADPCRRLLATFLLYIEAHGSLWHSLLLL